MDEDNVKVDEKRVRANASNAMARSDLSRLAGMQFNNDRDIDTNLGYTKTPSLDQYQDYYDRRGLASVIVDAPAKTTWRESPVIADGSEGSSKFIKGWNELQKRLRIFSYLERADRLSGIGHYGVVLIGTKDGLLSEDLTAVASEKDVIYLSTFSERYATVSTYEENVNDPRFGLPKTYSVDLSSNIVKGFSKSKEIVHYSRIIHIAEGLLENEVFGEPRLQKVYNRLQDLDKVVGPSAEAFWKMVIKGYALSPKEGYEWDDDAGVIEEWQDYMHNLQRLIKAEGVDFKELGTTPEDPTSVFSMLIQLIAGKTGIPQRILLGSERGNLASTQDEANWLGRIGERQIQHAEPHILRPLVDKLIDINALDAPKDGEYEVNWPGLFCLTDEEQAGVYEKRANAIAKITANQPLDMFDEAELREAMGFSAERENRPVVTNVLDEEDADVMAMFDEVQHNVL